MELHLMIFFRECQRAFNKRHCIFRSLNQSGTRNKKLIANTTNTRTAAALSAIARASATIASNWTYHKYTANVSPGENKLKSHISPEVLVLAGHSRNGYFCNS